MTLQGAIKQLHELRCNEDVPVYLRPAIAEVINTLLMDTQEVRHGHWIDPEDLTCYKCSVCGEYATQEYGLTEPIFWRYCPNCGSRMMDEEE